MTDALAHRGLMEIEGNVGIGHRRLVIIDLSPAGHQPMITGDHRYVLSYNVGVYNHCEIGTELEALGYRSRSQTDSEVVLNALAHWGPEALLKFNGIFGLALWDRKEQTLLMPYPDNHFDAIFCCGVTFFNALETITSRARARLASRWSNIRERK